MIQSPFRKRAKGGLFIENCRIVLHMQNWLSVAWYHSRTKVRLWGVFLAVLGTAFGQKAKIGKRPGLVYMFCGIIVAHDATIGRFPCRS